MRRALGSCAVAIVGAAFIGLATPRAGASPVEAGDDYFTSNDRLGNSLGAAVDLTSFGLGVIDLRGVSFGNLVPGAPSRTDTIVRRLQGLGPPFDQGDTGIIDIELVALQLRSVDPIDLGGGNFGELHITVNRDGLVPGLAQPDALAPSIGRMEIRHEDPDGGTFSAIFGDVSDAGLVPAEFHPLLTPGGGVFADAIMTVVGGDPGDPGDVVFSMGAPGLVLWSTGSWRHDPFSDFFITEIEHFCPFESCHPTEYVPAPGVLPVLAAAGLLASRRRR